MSRAEDLPEEILDRILYFVANDSYHSTGGVVNKAGLCSCSLTCRYWARRTIAALFDTISLRSHSDLNTLLDLFATSQRPIASDIRAIHIVQADDKNQPPWIHHALLRLGHKLPHLCEMVYSDVETKPKRHPNPVLPKGLPVFFTNFGHLRELWLQDQHFHSFTDFVHLVGRLSLLQTLSCGRLSWTNQTLHMPSSRSRCSSRLSVIHLVSCQAVWPAVWLFTAPATSQLISHEASSNIDGLPLYLDPDDAVVINDVIRCFLSHERMESSTLTLTRADQTTWHLKCAENSARMRPDESRKDGPCAPDITFHVALEKQRTSSGILSRPRQDPAVAYRLQAIEFSRFRDSSNPYRTDSLASAAWDELERIMVEGQSTAVRIQIKLPAENMRHIEAYEQLQEAILARMPSRRAHAEDDKLFLRVGWKEIMKAHSRGSTGSMTTPK
ncbi:hypothetical protein NM688_g3167 [Phlebia brevispora]|uniref:Uncharacterized protein n=1 Tax=Phlebia brevispora TaxID=194682 RepID=A0ACC1T6Q1_9APHY|nr:hypothetical protein NM688_g3167 [Phlebia brevispora]